MRSGGPNRLMAMPDYVVTLRRQEGAPELECRRFLWRLFHRVGLGPDAPLPNHPGMPDAPLEQEVTLRDLQDPDAVRPALEQAALACDPHWPRLYSLERV